MCMYRELHWVFCFIKGFVVYLIFRIFQLSYIETRHIRLSKSTELHAHTFYPNYKYFISYLKMIESIELEKTNADTEPAKIMASVLVTFLVMAKVTMIQIYGHCNGHCDTHSINEKLTIIDIQLYQCYFDLEHKSIQIKCSI